MDDEFCRRRNEAVLRRFMDGIGAADFVALAAVCTEDFVAELPYSDPPQRLENFGAYRAAVEPSLAIFRFRLELQTLHPGLDPDLIIAEYTSDGVAVPTGKPYRNLYIGVFRFREGRLAGIREFFNPVLAAQSLSTA
jgi:hypothetical protein